MKDYIITLEVSNWYNDDEVLLETRVIRLYNKTEDEVHTCLRRLLGNIVEDYCVDESVIDWDVTLSETFTEFAQEYFDEYHQTRFFVKMEES